MGETRELRKVFFDIIPVKEVNNEINRQFENLVESYIENAKDPELRDKIENEIDEAIYNFYSINNEEKIAIESVFS